MPSSETDLKNLRANKHFDKDFLVSKKLNNKVAIKYRIANSGMPVNVDFNRKGFVRPPKPTKEGHQKGGSSDTRGRRAVTRTPR